MKQERRLSVFILVKKGALQSYLSIYRHGYCFKEHVYKVSFENVECFFEVRFKFCDEDAKGITIARFLFYEKQTS